MPVVSPYGTYYHMPKAGGSWVNQVLLRRGGEVQGKGGHTPVWAFQSVGPSLGSIRNPWSWYASLYRYSVRAKRQGGIAYWGKATGSSDWSEVTCFRAFLYGMTHVNEVPEYEPGSLGVIFNVPEPFEAELRTGRQGFCSFTASYVYGNKATAGSPRPNWEADVLFDQARLREQLSTHMGEDLTDADLNVSRHVKTEFHSTNYSEWYDEEMVDWVNQADAWFIREMAFEPFGPGRNLPYRVCA